MKITSPARIGAAVVTGAIAIGEADDPATCARLALETKSIRFARWCA